MSSDLAADNVTPVVETVPSIDEGLVRRLVQEQFPQWAHLPVRAVEPQGWDNRTFRLGDVLTARLPSAVGYQAQVEKEQRWLPYLAAGLPLAVPAPQAGGVPGAGYPYSWSVLDWIDGESALAHDLRDPVGVARSLAGFLVALQGLDTAGGPAPGPRSAWRGGPLETYDGETREALAALADVVDVAGSTALWEAALAAPWDGRPVWFHGDVAAGNLLIRDDHLVAVIDFGCCGVGDPACDLTVAWTSFSGASRAAFRAALPLDDSTWARARGWALWKAVISASTAGPRDGPRGPLRVARDVVTEFAELH